MPQQRKRRRSAAATATGEGSRSRKRAAAASAAEAARESAQRAATAAALKSSAIVDITGVQCCPADAKKKILDSLTTDERHIVAWSFPFKDGERFDTVEFTQLSCYGPPTNKGRYALCTKLGEGSFSCVFKAWDTVSRDWVALKFTLSR